jgi:hypothetical protein
MVISPAGSYNFLWSPDNGTLSSIYAQSPNVTPVKIGTSRYTLNVSNAITGCATNATVTLNTYYCNVLNIPVKLKAAAADPYINLQWSINIQTRLQYYDLEHSTDGHTYTLVARVPVHNSKSYNLYDQNPAEGINFYRLKFVDAEGRYGYSNVEKIALSKKNNVTVYPNPAGQFVNIAVASAMINKPADITLISSDGRVMMQKKYTLLNKTERIELNNILSGKYYLRIASATGWIIKELTVVK